MIRVSCCVLLVLGLVLPVAGQRKSEKTKALKSVELKLKPARLKKGEEFRMGFGVEGDPKAEPLLGVWKRRKIYFFDLDGNGSIEAGKDGFASLPDPFIVRLPQRWLFHDGQYRVSSGDDGTLLLEPEDLGSIAVFQAAAAHVNDLRLKAGSPMAVLDRKASEDCRKHCDYLATHGMADGSGGLAAHVEEPDKAGYSEEGARAARYSCIGFEITSLVDGIDDWYRTSWHGAPIVDPKLATFGLALQNGVAMFYSPDPTHPDTNWVHPADGARDVATEFGARGEIPNPMPGTNNARGTGMPIYLQLIDKSVVLRSATLKDSKGREVEGRFSCPSAPATPEWPDNSGLALFIPEKPLKPRTTYEVQFDLSTGLRTWSFTTR